MLRDLRYALRVLSSKVGFTAAAVISLALGIGACTAIFSVVDGVLLRSLPYPDADRIVQLREVSEKGALMPYSVIGNYHPASAHESENCLGLATAQT